MMTMTILRNKFVTAQEYFGKDISITVHGLEHCRSDLETTEKANPDGQADVFLRTMG